VHATPSKKRADGPLAPLLQQRKFRRLTFARFTSRVAQNALSFALVLLVVDETGKAFFSSLLVLALVVPTTAAGIISGALSDAVPKRALMLLGHGLRAGLCFSYAGSLDGASDYFMIAVLMSVVNPLATSPEGASLPLIVDRQLLARANAINQASTGLSQLIGFGLLTPLMLGFFESAEALLWVCGGFFVLAAVNALFIGRIPSARRSEIGGEPEGRWYVVGWRALRSDRRVWQATVELTLISVSIISLGGLIPTYLDEILGLSVDVGVLVLVPAAAGVAIGLRLAGFLAHRVPHTLLSTSGFIVYVVALGIFASVNPVSEFLAGYEPFDWLATVDIGGFEGGAVVAMAVAFPLGFSFALVTVAAQTALNDLVSLRLQGRAQATQGALAALAASLPVLAAGVLADAIGVAPVIGGVAVVTGVLAIGRRGRHGLPSTS